MTPEESFKLIHNAMYNDKTQPPQRSLSFVTWLKRHLKEYRNEVIEECLEVLRKNSFHNQEEIIELENLKEKI